MKKVKTLREEMMDYLQKNEEMTSYLINAILMEEELDEMLDPHIREKEALMQQRIELKNKELARLHTQLSEQSKIIEQQAKLIEELKQQKETLA